MGEQCQGLQGIRLRSSLIVAAAMGGMHAAWGEGA